MLIRIQALKKRNRIVSGEQAAASFIIADSESGQADSEVDFEEFVLAVKKQIAQGHQGGLGTLVSKAGGFFGFFSNVVDPNPGASAGGWPQALLSWGAATSTPTPSTRTGSSGRARRPKKKSRKLQIVQHFFGFQLAGAAPV